MRNDKIVNYNETIPQRIARLRKEAGLTQYEFSKILGISRSTLAVYETGKLRLHDDLIIKIAEHLNVSADVILGLKGIKPYEAEPSLRFLKRLKEIEMLPEARKKMILRNLDDIIIASHKS